MSVIPFPSPAATAFPVREPASSPPSLAARRASPQEIAPGSLLAQWLRRWRGRQVLAALDRDQIRDADLDPFAVRREAMKPFWRA